MIRKMIKESACEKTSISIAYGPDEICPICGRYSVDGFVCINCQKDYDLYKPKVTYPEL
jgi:hypothetical protein